MANRVATGLRIVRMVAERPDPTVPSTVGALARDAGIALSRASRLCAELERAGLLARGEAYGTYRLGAAALRLSGRATAPFATAVRHALLVAGKRTGETVLLAAPAGAAMVVTAAEPSGWTLYSPAEVGEVVLDDGAAIARAVRGDEPDRAGELHAESTLGMCVEVATPVRTPTGERIAALAVRLPVNRARAGVRAARRALDAARRIVERAVAVDAAAPAPERDEPAGPPEAGGTSASLDAAVAILRHLAEGRDTIAGTARATGLRRDRVQRLLDSSREADVVHVGDEPGTYRLGWSVHGWHRAAAEPMLMRCGEPLVAAASARHGVCAFITVLSGMRSVTRVEVLESVGEGLRMTPWLGRPCPITGADGGPTLVMDLEVADIDPLLPRRATARDHEEFLERVRQVKRAGVLAKDSFEEAGQMAVSAPIRDASGGVAAAACIVGTPDDVRGRLEELKRAARDLAREVAAALGHEPAIAWPGRSGAAV
ncbi:IclR family transcriptional regulator domain-containing protein [Microbacterium marinilacus]|uniref:IclR family transcriptional regulator n=1 Tax=Microbacterium marinilacus TaxID=415209 RepID=A0ABP7BKR6_9MICO|nr:IclR family transcriptional regulator C-terminal domain-containing protein [Microbacterium marinilacus]MBY0689780.1 helix-turn-helix domain-containing protein [Microbacterium marinilacus]